MALEPLQPEVAVEQYLASREHDCAESTVRDHRYRLKQFLVWADEIGLDDMNDLTGRDCEQFKNWRITECDVNQLTLENHLRTFRVFVRWCESVDAVTEGTADKIIIPRLSKGEKTKEIHIESEQAAKIIDYLCRFEWATTTHIVFHTLFHTGVRRGALHGLDTEDWHSTDGYLSIRHRPETDTPLKLKNEGERNINISDDRLAEALDDYIEHNRHSVTDDHGRSPLLTSKHGRLSAGAIQHYVYKVTRPCYYGVDCPHGRDEQECEAMTYETYSKCPSSVSPHAIRRSSIVHHLNQDVPKEIASERMSVSVDTLEEHYDARSKEDRRRNRARYLDNV